VGKCKLFKKMFDTPLFFLYIYWNYKTLEATCKEFHLKNFLPCQPRKRWMPSGFVVIIKEIRAGGNLAKRKRHFK
jgi:hypothetical protein